MQDALRVLYLLPAEGFGGAERQGLLHLAELPRHGVEVTALVGPGAPMMRAMSESTLPGAELDCSAQLSAPRRSSSSSRMTTFLGKSAR